MSYVKTINEDGVVSDIMAKALDPTLDATILHKSDLVNGFTQTTPGVNALDAAAGKTLNDSLANLSTDVSTNYATKTDLANGYVPQTNSLNFPGWSDLFTFRTDTNNLDITLPCASLKNGTLSRSANVAWNLLYIIDTSNPSLGIARNITLSVSSVVRENRDTCVLRCSHPSEISESTVYGFAINRAAFTISST